MSVLLPDRDLTVTVKTHPWTRDAHGTPVPGATQTEVRGPYPGAAREGEAGAWTLRVDARCWPIEVGDTITDGTLTWVVASRRLATVVGHPDVDHVAVQAELEPPQVP